MLQVQSSFPPKIDLPLSNKQEILAAHLRTRIQSLPPGSKLPSTRWLTRQFGMSLQTVAAAIDRLAMEGLVIRKQGSGVYVSPQAEKRCILFVRNNHPSANFELIETGLRRAARSRLWALHVYRKEQHEEGLWISPSIKPAAVIMMSDIAVFDLDALRRLYPDPAPVIVIGTSGMAPQTDFVTTDDQRGIEMLLEHLVGLGHRRIGFVNNEPPFPEVLERMQAFRILCRDRFALESAPVIDCHLSPWDDVAAAPYHKMMQWLEEESEPKCTAFIACSFPGAIATMRAALDRGYKVPEEISVASLNEEAYADYLSPRPTTLWWDLQAIGEECLRLAGRRFGSGVAKCLGARIAPQLRLRDSCGPPPQARRKR